MTSSRCVLSGAIAVALTACSASDSSDMNGGRGGSSGNNGQASTGGGAGNAGASGGSAPNFGHCGAVSEGANNTLQPADIIFAIDNSGSMDEEIVFVRENMNAFSQQIVQSGIDVRIIVVSAAIGMVEVDEDGDDDDQDNGICIDAPLGSGNCPDDTNLPSYLHVAQEVDSNDALNLFISTYPSWRDQLRPNATKTFVVVTDDDAEDGPNNSAAAFSASVMGLDPVLFSEWSFAGIFCFTECPEAAAIGQVYVDLVAQTGGVSGDLCLQDFEPVFDALAQSVIGASGLDCEWALPSPPMGQVFDKALVNVQYTPSTGGAAMAIFGVPAASACDQRGGWHYDDPASPRRVVACPSTCDQLQGDPQARVEVLFGCETEGPD